jgi:hypothetical protein
MNYFYLDELDEDDCRIVREDSILRLAIIYRILKTEFWKPDKRELKKYIKDHQTFNSKRNRKEKTK